MLHDGPQPSGLEMFLGSYFVKSSRVHMEVKHLNNFCVQSLLVSSWLGNMMMLFQMRSVKRLFFRFDGDDLDDCVKCRRRQQTSPLWLMPHKGSPFEVGRKSHKIVIKDSTFPCRYIQAFAMRRWQAGG